MPILTVRGVDEEMAKALKRVADEEGLSVNSLVIKIIRQSLGFEKHKGRRYSDIDHLAGTWSEEEYSEFESNTASFESIDRKLW